MYLPKSENGNFELTPAGTFIGRCYRFIDLGSHEQKFQGESKGLKRLIMIGFELPTELMEDGRPFSIHKRYTWSMHEKAAMRKDLESWRGAKFSEGDFGDGGFDTRNLLGVPATLTIVHSEGQDNVYANIASIGKAMKGIQIPEPVNTPVYFSLERDRFDAAVMDTLSDKLKEFIRQTPEYRNLQNKSASYGEQTGHDDARDPRFETGARSSDERNPPPRDFDSDFPGDWPMDQAGRQLHPAEA